MNRKMRRADRELSPEAAARILEAGEYGTLATVGSDGEPYNVPLSYACGNGRIYFHCAGEGRKLDNLKAHPRVCFTVVGRTRVLPEKFSTCYESVMVYGTAAVVEGAEKMAALLALLEKYCADHLVAGRAYLERQAAGTTVIAITIETVTGKSRPLP